MADKTEITYGYLRTFRKEHIEPLLVELRDQKANLEDYIDVEGSPTDSIRAGNRALFSGAGRIEDTINSSVVAMRDQVVFLIKELEGLSDRLEDTESAFSDAESDAVLTAYELAKLIDPENAAAVQI